MTAPSTLNPETSVLAGVLQTAEQGAVTEPDRAVRNNYSRETTIPEICNPATEADRTVDRLFAKTALFQMRTVALCSVLAWGAPIPGPICSAQVRPQEMERLSFQPG